MVDSQWIKSAADERAIRNGCYFDERAGYGVVEFFPRFLRHSKGSQWAGKPFDLLDWQRDEIILPLFGWKRADGTRRFRKTYIEVPKKNGKSTLASGVGLYLLVADGEPGAEIYSAAADQGQASIVHGEAINMIDASPELSSVLTVNLSTKAISYAATKSWYKALSKDAHKQEGLNAHGIIFDELHAVQGRRFWNSLKYAFRARRQGLLFVITTAGDSEQTICYEQHLYAKDVLAGTVEDDRFFAYIRAAEPADDWTAEATWRKANPSFGITIDPIEFAADVAEAKKTPTTVAEFKRYGLDLWSTGIAPWLHQTDWQACRESFTEESLKGRDCFAGLDLSRTEDMSAFVLCFPDIEDRFLFLPYFWLPHDRCYGPDAFSEHHIWAEQGCLETTPGNTVDYKFIKRRIGQLSKLFRIREVAYDVKYANELTEEIENEFGIVRRPFPQNVMNFAGPTAEFQRLVIGKHLRHNGHPILAAQAGYVQVYRDANGNMRPIKPKHDGGKRKIDGIVSGIMSLASAMLPENKITTGGPLLMWSNIDD